MLLNSHQLPCSAGALVPIGAGLLVRYFQRSQTDGELWSSLALALGAGLEIEFCAAHSSHATASDTDVNHI